ncbi:MAG TPA: hypothetical protein PLL92_16190, partial [Alicycliphilus sp.]|nr:hypothetical protein [Alicycliphilus sp.]
VSLVRGTWCIIANQAYSACLRGQLSSNYKGFPTQASNSHPGSIAQQWTQALALWFSDQIGRLLRWAGS